jgi:hypothetical protein
VKQPWPDRLANRPNRRSIQCKDRLTPCPDARSSVDRAEVTTVTSPLHWLTRQENSVACAAPTAVPPARVRLTAAKFGLRRHRKLRLARPQGSDSTSTSDDGLRLARPRRSDSTSTTEDGLRLARPQGSDSTSTPDDGLRLARPRSSDSTSTSDDGLRLARPQGSDSTSTSDDGLRLARPQGSDSASTPDDGLRLARPQGSDSASTLEEPPPRPTLGSGRPRRRGVHHYPTPS